MKLSFSPAIIIKAFKILALFMAVIAVTGFFILPAVLRPVLEKQMSEAIHRPVTIRAVYINPFTLAFALRGVTINQRDASEVMLSFDEFYVNMQSLSVVKGGLIVSSVRLVKPYVSVARNKDLTYNFSDLLTPGTTPPKEEKKKEPLKFSINNIEVKNGSADFFDAPRNTRHTVRDVNIGLPFLSNLPYDLSSYVQPLFEATVNGTAIVLKGKTLPFNESLETTLDINWKGLNIPHYLAYSPVPLKIQLLSGTLDVQATFSFRQFKDRSPSVSVKGTLDLNNIRLAATGTKRFLEFPSLSISFLPSDLMEKEVHLSEVRLRSPKLYVERDRGGELVIMKALLAQLRASQDRQEPAPVKAGPMPIIDIDAFSIQDGMLQFLDWEPVPVAGEGEDDTQEPAKVLIDAIGLKAGSLSTRKDSRGRMELSVHVNRKGTVQTSGSLGLVPLDLDTTVKINGIELAPFQPYIAQRADVFVGDGRLSADGTARVRAGEAGVLSTTYRGSASISRLALRDSSDNDLLTWKLLQFSGIEAGSSPLSLKIKTVALSDFAAGIVVEEDGTLNFQKIAKKGPATGETAQEETKQEETKQEETKQEETKQGPSPFAEAEKAHAQQGTPPDIAIGQVLFANGSVNFTDRYVKPMYTANLVEIGGKVSGLSSRKDMMADLLLDCSLDQYAPLVITGKIHPLGNDLSADIRADFKDMDLSLLTPYSGTYIGRAIEKGKLSFGLEYHIAKKKLEAKNNIFIDQLTLGEKIDSPKATSLPVGLAISLLKDRKGEIRLDIPVAGEIDNPEFRVWKVVLQVLGNLLVKAATSPFALLGSMMGGEDLGYVEFDYGTAKVTEQNLKKLDDLVNALYNRPSLKLEIAGYVDSTKDSDALRTGRMKNMLVAQKMKGLSRKDDQPVSPESVQINAAEYPIYLKKAYKSGKFAKPRNVLGIAKDIPDAEMEKLLLASIQINDDDLRQLASQRARAIKDVILRSQKIEQERIFLVEPKSLQPEPRDKLKKSRVDFSLK
jgi:uncharacterized protein involved in outer membrane biogenesis